MIHVLLHAACHLPTLGALHGAFSRVAPNSVENVGVEPTSDKGPLWAFLAVETDHSPSRDASGS